MELQEGIEIILGENPNYEQFELVTDVPVNDEPIALSTSFLSTANEFLEPSNIVTEEEMLELDPTYQPVSSSEIPRKMTEEEIKRLIDGLTDIDCIDSETSAIVTEQYRRKFRQLLADSETEFVVSEPTFALLSDQMNKRMASALSTYGEKYGNLGSFALSCAETQVTFKFKKVSGAGKTSILKNGIDYIKAIFHATKRPSRSYCGIHFNRKMSYRELIDFSYQIKRITVDDLLSQPGYSIGQLKVGEIDPGIAHQFYASERSQLHYPKVYCLRLHFDKDKLFAHKLTPYDVSMLLQKNETIAQNTRIIPSPFEEGYIDIVSQLALNRREEGPNEYVSDLKFVILPKIRNYQLQGVPGIQETSVQRVAYHSLFQAKLRKPTLEERAEYSGDYVVLCYDMTAMANTMQPNHLFIEDSLKKAGVTIKYTFRTELAKRIYGYAVDPKSFNRKVKLSEFRRRVAADGIKRVSGKFVVTGGDTVESQLQRDGYSYERTDDGYVVEIPGIKSVGDAFAYLQDVDSHYCYITVEGRFTNVTPDGKVLSGIKPNILRFLSAYPEIDFSRFTTNSLPYMAKFFGIEVCRNYEIYAIAENQRAKDSKSQPRFTVLLADHTSFYGEPLGTDFYQNARKKDNDFASVANISHAKQVFDTYANRGGGSSALITTTPTSILLEGRIRAGESIAPTLTQTKEAVLKSLRRANQAKLVTSFDIADALKRRIEGALEEVGERLIEAESMTIKPPLLPPRIPVVLESLVGELPAAPSGPVVEFRSKQSPYTKDLQFEVPVQASPLAPVVLSLQAVRLPEIISLIQRKPHSPFTIEISSFSLVKQKQRRVRNPRLPSVKNIVDEEVLFFDPLDFLEIPVVRFTIAEEEISFDELKSYF